MSSTSDVEEDASRAALFAGASADALTNNPYENFKEKGDTTPVVSSGNNRDQHSRAQDTNQNTEDDPDERARNALLSGAKTTKQDTSESPSNNKQKEEQEEGVEGEMDETDYHFDFEDLNLSSEEIDFAEIDSDLAKFQKVEIVKEALEKGVDLRQYARQIDKELHDVEFESIKDYVKHADDFSNLYGELTTCEDILEQMQNMLGKFQSNLSGISDEIKTLQNESLSLNVKLRNRREVADRLRLFLEKVAVSEEMVHSVCGGAIDANWIEQIQALSRKIKYNSRPHGDRHHMQNTSHTNGEASQERSNVNDPFLELGIQPADTLAGQDALPTLERLRVKAVTRSREHLLSKIAELRKPKTNIQKQQQYILIKISYLYEFLLDHAPDIALEIRVAYIECMGRTIHTTFRAYWNALQKLQISLGNKQDVIVVEQNAVRGLFSTKVDVSKRTDTFVIGTRDQVVREPDAPPITAHIAQSEKKKYPFEVIFRSLQRHLMDAACAEYAFLVSFFGEQNGNDVFVQVFARTVSLILESLENYLFNCYDVVGILLLIHVTQQHRDIMKQRDFHCLDSYFDRVTMLLWPRFKTVFDANLLSVRQAEVSKLGKIEQAPHYVTRRFAELSASILRLHRSLQQFGMSDDMVLHNLTTLRKEMQQLWRRLSTKLSSNEARIPFVINNIQQCIDIWRQRRVLSDDLVPFEDMLSDNIGQFVETELRKYFSKLIDFVNEVEANMHQLAEDTNQANETTGGSSEKTEDMAYSGAATSVSAAEQLPDVHPDVSETTAQELVKQFADQWKKALAHINETILQNFASYTNGIEILKKVLTQLLMYYTRFQAILKKAFPENPSFMRDLVAVPTIFSEIKKYSRNLS